MLYNKDIPHRGIRYIVEEGLRMTDNIVITPAAQRLLDKRGTNELTISLTLASHG